MKKFTLTIAILIILFQLTSCGKSTIKFAFNNIDTVIYYMINRHLKLETGQSKVLKKVISKNLNWIRKEGFKDYILILSTLKPKISKKVTMQDVSWVEKEFKKHQVILFKKIYPDVVDLVVNLNKKQIAIIKKRINKRRKKQKEESSMSAEEKFEKSFKGVLKMMKFIYGNFSKQQKNEIKKLALKLPDISEDSSKYNKKRIDKFIYTLENYKSKKEIENLVRSFLFSSIDKMPKNYRNKVLSLKLATEKFLLSIHNNIITRKQKKHASKRLGEVIQAFKELQAQT